MSENHRNFSLLLVDDEAPVLKVLEQTFVGEQYDLHKASSGREALEMLDKVQVDAVLSDLLMPDMNGLELLKKMKGRYPTLMVIILTGHGEIKDAVKAIRMGADDFLEKPFSPDTLRIRIDQLFKMWELRYENQRLRDRIRKNQFGFHRFVGNSTPILKLKDMIARVGLTDAPILIQGETGTGKELVARALHYHSSRSKTSFVPVDCAAISDTVIESELFGHVKGAFTGAHTSALGLIRSADKGTLFLDEIGELSMTIQAKLLRSLQEKEVRPVGSNRIMPVNIRLLAATNRDLRKQIVRGKFREDLFYRINVLTVKVPPLRDRREDVPLLARYFLSRFATNSSPVKEISQEALTCLENYDWPGNIRELENAIRRAIALAKNEIIQPYDLPKNIYGSPAGFAKSAISDLADSLVSYEKAAIQNALFKERNNRSRAAHRLQIGEATLYRKIKKYGITT